MHTSSHSILDCLLNEQLSSVTFVQDYLQLHFDGPFFNAYIWPLVKIGGTVFRFEQSGYRDAICGLISKKVIKTQEVPDQFLGIEFQDGSSIEFSLKEQDREGPEALVFHSADPKRWNVW